MARQDRIGKTATVVFVDTDGMTKVVYHSTPVVSFNDKVIILKTGGWKTVTTKTRMNQTARQFALGFSVYQEDGDWFVDFNGKVLDFDADKRFYGLTLQR